jgi:YspA, cpYpsA-related SLOG family
MEHRILITGSREYADYNCMQDAILDYTRGYSVVVHGGARGADQLAQKICDELHIRTEVHMADWEHEGKRAGVLRNQHMVNLGADICLAFPIGESRGTRDCIKRARKAGIPVEVL